MIAIGGAFVYSAIINRPIDPSWQLGFSDEFDKDTLDAAHWSTCYHFGQVQNGKLVCAIYPQEDSHVSVPENVLLQDGLLRLQVQRAPTQAFNRTFTYTSGMVSSVDRFSFLYGYAEIRARVPNGAGLWPAFWLMPASKQWPPEIDVMEILGREPNILRTTLHYADATGAHQFRVASFTGPDFSQDFHRFGVKWTPDKLIWFVDGIEQHRETRDVPQQPMYILLTHGTGNGQDFAGAVTADTVFPSYFEIDYVRVYQPPSTQDALNPPESAKADTGAC